MSSLRWAFVCVAAVCICLGGVYDGIDATLQATAKKAEGVRPNSASTSLAIGEPYYTSGNDTYVTVTTPLNLSASNVSGASETWYRIWNGTWSNWTLYAGNFTLAGQSGTVYVEFNSTDAMGNAETPLNQTLIVDVAAPVPTLSISAPRSGLNPVYVTTATEFNLTATDAASGVAHVWYRIDAGAWTEYAGDFSMTGAGAHNVTIVAQDNLGMNSTVQTFHVFVDETAPATTIEIVGPSYNTSPTYVNSTTQIRLNATDSGAGIDIVRYRIDGGSWLTYSGPINLTSPGLHTIEYRALDNLGNAETIKELDIFVDDELPEVEGELGWPKYGSSPTYLTSSTALNLTATDADSGLAGIWYSIDGGAWTQYASTLSFATSGAHTIDYYAEDNLGQAGATETLDVVVDDDAPTALSNPGATNGVIALAKGGSVTLSAVDTGVGSSVIYYSLDGGTTWLQYAAPLEFDGDATLMFYAEDLLGNRGANVTAEIDVPGGGGLGDLWWIIIVVVIVVLLLLFKKYQANSKVSEAKLRRSSPYTEDGDTKGEDSTDGEDHQTEELESAVEKPKSAK